MDKKENNKQGSRLHDSYLQTNILIPNQNLAKEFPACLSKLVKLSALYVSNYM